MQVRIRKPKHCTHTWYVERKSGWFGGWKEFITKWDDEGQYWWKPMYFTYEDAKEAYDDWVERESLTGNRINIKEKIILPPFPDKEPE
jgi:hypothetical protein